MKYLSNATSTFILRASRAHHRLVWAALTLMDKVPCVSGRPCVFRVVRVSGTMRKVEDEVILRSRAMMQAAKDEMAGKSSDTLHALFGGQAQDRDAAMVDALDEGAASDEGEESDAG